MFSHALLILPDFALILIGWLLLRFASRSFDRGFWAGMEKLVYFLLFPALLFTSINSAQFSLAADSRLIIGALATFFAAVALGFAAKPLLHPPPDVFAGGVQTAFRFNSYIALALAQALLGSPGVALLALVMAFIVPLNNVFAVLALAHNRKTGVLAELARNPLLLATLAGLATNLLGWKVSGFASIVLSRLGSASIALGLLCVGAGLSLSSVQVKRSVLGYFIAVKLLVYPALGLLAAHWLALPPLQTQLLVLFCAVPTASSAYVLAARMGVNAAPVAFLISTQTLLSMVTLPIWVGLAAR